MVNATIQKQYKKLVKTTFVTTIANKVLKILCIPDKSELSVIICSDEFIQDLNCKYRLQDEPTDVLSFPSDEIDPQTDSRYYGDVIISYPRTVAQAQAGGHAVEDELALLIVHGILHLLGYDHEEENKQKEMWKIQNGLLINLGFNIRI